MKSKSIRVALISVLIIVILSGTCSAGFIAGQVFPISTQTFLNTPLLEETSTHSGSPDDSDASEASEKLFAPFWQAWRIVHEEYVEQPVDNVTLMRGAISGMLQSLDDKYTTYMNPNQYESSNSQLHGEYEGIGAWVDISEDYLTIISPMPGSPAEKAGLKSGDQIIAIDGEDMTGIDGEAVRQRVLGPEGSTLEITVYRSNDDSTFEVEIIRASITVPSIHSKMLDNDIAYVQILIFGDDTAEDLREALEKLLSQDPQGLIIDLRNNGGGYLESAVAVGSEFIADGVITYEEYGDGSTTSFDAKPGGIATDIPIVALINEGTASASEIVAGAIQDYQRGVLVGATSFGKGSVQTVTLLDDDQGAVRVTVARWLTPDKRHIQGVGLTPDYEIQISEEDIQTESDPQLDKAIEIITE